LKACYQAGVRAYHPDKAWGNQVKFQRLATAYETLKRTEVREVATVRFSTFWRPTVHSLDSVSLLNYALAQIAVGASLFNELQNFGPSVFL